MGFKRATVVDLVDRISRVVTNYAGPDPLADLDAVIRPLLYHVDANLLRALAFAVLAGAQEAARLALLISTAAGYQPPAEFDLDDALMQLRRMAGGFSAFTAGSREGEVEPVPRRDGDEPDLATTSVESVATDDRPTMTTCVEELQQRSRKESVGGPGHDRPAVFTERDSQSEFRQDVFRRRSAGKDNLNETLSLDAFDSRQNRTYRQPRYSSGAASTRLSGVSSPQESRVDQTFRLP